VTLFTVTRISRGFEPKFGVSSVPFGVVMGCASLLLGLYSGTSSSGVRPSRRDPILLHSPSLCRSRVLLVHAYIRTKEMFVQASHESAVAVADLCADLSYEVRWELRNVMWSAMNVGSATVDVPATVRSGGQSLQIAYDGDWSYTRVADDGDCIITDEVGVIEAAIPFISRRHAVIARKTENAKVMESLMDGLYNPSSGKIVGGESISA